ncbi:MAG: hypothetical protein M3020_08245 [Myxococcota bacterium]|nr:hypothetical protein [Myxococcota bacterium]
MANRNPKSGPIVDARRAIATIDESSSEAELRLAEELIAEGLEYAERQLKGLPTRAMYLRDAVTELTAMRETFARTWRPVETAAPAVCEAGGGCFHGGSNLGRVIELEAFRARRTL